MMNSLPDYWFDQTAKTQRPTVSLDSGGGVIASYTDNIASIACRLVVGGGGENGRDRLSTQNPYRVYFSGKPDITAKDRIVFSSRVLDIQTVNNFDEAGVYTRCDCTEVLPSGVGA